MKLFVALMLPLMIVDAMALITAMPMAIDVAFTGEIFQLRSL